MDCWDVNDNLTKELNTLKEKYENAHKISLKYTMPRIQFQSVNDFREHKKQLASFLEVIGLLFILENKNNCSEIVELVLEINNDHEIILKIINDLNELTHYQNKIWCETRVKNALQTISPLLRNLSTNIDFDRETILSCKELCEIISNTFIESIINFEDTIETDIDSIAYYSCFKCKQDQTYLSEDKKILLCSECTEKYQQMKVIKCEQASHTDNNYFDNSLGMEPEPEPELCL